MAIDQQFDAILALPIGGAVIAAALGFFVLYGTIVRHVIRERAERRAMLRDLADRMLGGQP